MTAYIPVELRRQVRADAGRRCGYCRSSEALMGMPLEIEHIIPESMGGLTVRENLWLACHRCNKFKADRIQAIDPLTEESAPLFNPRIQGWHEHFAWSIDGLTIVGVTTCGRATIEALQINNDYVVEARRFWVMAGWHPPAAEEKG
jgi:hypothetical protein